VEVYKTVDTQDDNFLLNMSDIVSGLHNVKNLCDEETVLVRGLYDRDLAGGKELVADDGTSPSEAAKRLRSSLISVKGFPQVPDAGKIRNSNTFRQSWLLRTVKPISTAG
jgi:hypothetical protein